MQQFSCPFTGCPTTFKSQKGRTYHVRSMHHNENTIPIPQKPPLPPRNNDLEDYDLDLPVRHESERFSPTPPPPAGPQRIFHPHLNGLFLTVFYSLKHI